MTIKTGVASSKSYPYSAIADVRHEGLTSLNSTLYIQPYKGAEIKLLGFSRSDFKLIQQAVANGYFEDGYDEDNDEQETISQSKTSEYEQNKQKKITRLNSQMDSVREIGISSDEEGIVEVLNKLLSVLDETATTETNEEQEKTELRKSAKKKFDSQFQMLCSIYPQNKMIPYYASKVQEWEKTENDRKVKDKKQTKIIVIAIISLISLFILIPLIFG